MDDKCDDQNASFDASSFIQELSDKEPTLPLYIVIASSENDTSDINADSEYTLDCSNIVEDEQKSSTLGIDDTKSLSNKTEQMCTENTSKQSVCPETIAVSDKKDEKATGLILESPKSDSSQKPKISRELKGLQKAAAESKIITEFTNITEKMRSRKTLNSPTSNRLRECESGRKSADMSCTDVISPFKRENEKSPKTTKSKLVGKTAEPKKQNPSDEKKYDLYCWQCHLKGVDVSCKTCPRSFHMNCLKGSVTESQGWCCFECLAVIQAETTDMRSDAMKQMSLNHLCQLLKFALRRMINYVGEPMHAVETFLRPVDKAQFPDYDEYIVHPMDLSLLGHNINKNLYGSTEAFIADTKWILHNSIIYNSFHSKVTNVAKGIVKVCKQEMNEIATCPECYYKANSNTDTNWFLEVCSQPHMVVWAKLKGYPYWPAKSMTVAANGLVDVRFFGAHDKAWIPMRDCLLYSEKDPNYSDKGKRTDFVESVKELGIYIKNLEKRFGKFCYAPFKTAYPADQDAIYEMMLPSYNYKESTETLKDEKSPIRISKLDKSTVKTEHNKEDSCDSDDDDVPLISSVKDSSKSNISTSENTEGDNVVKITPLRGGVRMRGGKINTSGRIKIINIVRKAEPTKPDDAPKQPTQNDPMKNGKRSNVGSSSPTKSIKGKTNTESTEPIEKRVKKDIEIPPQKNLNTSSLTIENVEIKSKDNVRSENVTISKAGCSTNDKDNKISPGKPTGKLDKPFKIINKLPQISITGLPKGITIEKYNANGNKPKEPQPDDIGTATITVRKRSSLAPTPSPAKKQSTTETKMDKNTAIPVTSNNAKIPISSDNLEKNPKSLNTQVITKSNVTLPNDIDISQITTPLITEIKTEPMDYEMDQIEEANSPNELSLEKKQSARKSFTNRACTSTSVVPNLVSDSMVHVHDTGIKNMNETPALSQLYQSASSSPGCSSGTRSWSNDQMTTVIIRSSDDAVPQQALVIQARPQPQSEPQVQPQPQPQLEPQAQPQSQPQSRPPSEPQPSTSHQTNRVVGPLSADLPGLFPSSCGPVTKLLNDNALKISDYFRSLMQETIADFAQQGSKDARIKQLEAENEALKWLHKQVITEMKHNQNLILWEMRTTCDLAVKEAHTACDKRIEDLLKKYSIEE